nr:Haloacid dehalogenase-like hydrolase [uncultured bacterium]
MSNIEAVIWDMDGVLVDTGEFHFQSWQEALAAHDISLSREGFQATFGMNNKGILQTLMGDRYADELIGEIGDPKEARFREAIQGKLEMLPGARALLEALHDLEVPMAIGSSAPVANIEAIVNALEIGGYFQAQVSGATMPGKPDPSVFLTAARELGIDPAHCLVIEDALAGIAAARAAGMKVIAVTTTYPAEELRDAQPNLVVTTLEELDAERVLNIQ